MTDTTQTPKIRFKFNSNYNQYKLGEITQTIERPIEMKDDSLYSLVTVKRRNEGIVKRGDFFGKDIKVKNQFIIKSGDFLISKRQIIHGACEIVPESLDGSIVSNEYYVLHGKEGILLNDYLNLLSKTSLLKRYFKLACVGVDIEKMLFRIDDWNARTVLIPSLDEQQKIISFFSLINHKIEKQREKIEQLELFKKGMLQKIFSQEIRFKDENGKEFPNWKETYLGDIGETYGGLSGKTKDDFGIGESYFITYMNVFSNVVAQIEGVERVSIKENENQHKVKLGDILFTTSSETPEEVGMASVWNYDIPDVYLNSFCFGFRLKHDVDPVFLAYMLRSSSYRKNITLMAQGSTRYNLSKTNLMKMKVHLPQKAEQEKIKLLLLKLDQKILMETEKLNELKLIKKGFMQQMFV
ncbi:restriction endonuclease subunit S [Brevibacillus borstelensis]|uniref:restriction endonuclease subunit S n=1 Tax=Brevibacillus borstelensis TaxID=45462 RepID=UPI002E1FD559|nr:restriction endonuclease subunit S [Brevibacillus borstelensis]